MPETSHVFVIDDDQVFARTIARALRMRKFEVTWAADPALAMAEAAQKIPDYVVLDLNLGEVSGLNLIRPLKALNRDMKILVLTGYASIPTAVDSIKSGATHYVAKPASIDEILTGLGIDPLIAAAPLKTQKRPGPYSLDRVEWEHIRRHLAEQGGNVSATARVLNMNLRTLQRKLSRHQGATQETLARLRQQARRARRA